MGLGMLGLFVGGALLLSGLVLLSHLSYQNGKEPSCDQEGHGVLKNDCILPLCYFRTANVRNHETWVVACLLSGSAVLLLSML